jgi:menaquinone-dependent protoporphyrinogen oxidase
MSRILVMFGTTDGHTRKVAQRLAGMFAQHGLDADVVEAGTAEVDPDYYSAAVVCASVHAGGYQRSVQRWVTGHAAQLRSKPTAFVSVCLAVLQDDPAVKKELDAINDRFLKATAWQPTVIKNVAGALLYRQYGLIKRWMMKRIVAKAGGETDTSRDYEYTNWDDLAGFAKEFSRLVTPARDPVKVAAGF